MSEIPRELQLTLQAAWREALARRHAYLTVEHLLFALLHDDRGADILRHCGADLDVLKQALLRFFAEDLESEPGEDPFEARQTLAFHRVLQHALVHAESAEKDALDAGDLLAAIFQEPDSYAVALLRNEGVSRLDVLRYISHGIAKVPGGRSNRADSDAYEGIEGLPTGEGDEEAEEGGDPLAAFATNLNELAVRGQLDPLVGRGRELERAIHILARRRKNNPIFVGEAGVGKTALAEGLARRIHEGRVPDDLREAEVWALDLGALLAGTKYRGDFEARFKALVGALRERPHPILFIDEIHTILGAGSAQGGTVDASNLLKPLLQSGELRCMGSTTYAEYRHFEKDRALARRFQRVDVHEPTRDEAVRILGGLRSRYEDHHGVRYTRPALEASVDLSSKHLHERYLPDKAIDVMDEAGAAVRLRPGARRRRSVTVRDVEAVVSRMAQVPLARTSASERARLEELEDDLRGVVFGQEGAISTVVRAVKRAHAGLAGPERPMGSFLFVGPTGVGKTELARQLARTLGVAFLRFDMSEYMEKHAVSRLIGAPPGYVGYDQGGQLVERIRKTPYAVLLLDEIEKAHPDLFDVLLQVMDRAVLTDNQGREADFRHVTLIMTSNAGSRERAARAIGFGDERRSDGRREVERLFRPEFRNRLDEVVEFAPLPLAVIGRVVDKFVAELGAQLREKKVTIELAPAARDWLADRGYDADFGARPMARLIQTELKDRIADEVLFGRLQKGGHIRADVEPGGERLALELEPR